MFLLLAAIFIISRASSVIFVNVIILVIGLGFAVVGIYTGSAFGTGLIWIAGLLIAYWGAASFYHALAIGVNTITGRPVLSLGKPIIK